MRVRVSLLLLASLATASQPPPQDRDVCLAFHAQEQLDAADQCYQRLRQSTGAAFPWAYYQAHLEKARSYDLPAAIARMREAVAAEPSYMPARIHLAWWLVELGRNDEVTPLIESLLQSQKASAVVHYLAGKLRQSIEHLETAVRLEPRFPQAHYELALALRRQGRRAEAAEHLRLFQQNSKVIVAVADPLMDRMRAMAESASAHLLDGKRFEESGDLQAALEAYGRAIAADPKMGQAHVNRIGVLARLGDFEQARTAFATAIAIDPAIPEAYYNYGVALLAAKRLDEAALQFRKAIGRNPHYADAHNNLGLLLRAKGETAAAEAAFREALANQPKHPEAHLNLARLLSAAQPEAAERHFQQALAEEDHRSAAYRYYYAEHLRQSGRIADAMVNLTQAQTLAERYEQKQLADYLSGLLRQWRQ